MSVAMELYENLRLCFGAFMKPRTFIFRVITTPKVCGGDSQDSWLCS